MEEQVKFDQIQGIVRFGYGKLTECSYLLLAIKDGASARRWLASAPVTSAVALPDAPDTALQVALTYEGLRNLGCDSELMKQFSIEFKSGMGTSDARARLLGDVGSSAPEQWAWGAGAAAAAAAAANEVHVLLMLYAHPGMLMAWRSEIETRLWQEAFHVVRELTTTNLDGVEPFGFPDGLSQPEVDWKRQRTPRVREDKYTNRIALGEFLLGYPNEYNRYTARPLLPSDGAAASLLPVAEEDPGKRDFGRNGCYLVLRTLEQDVPGFWTFVRAQSESEEAAEALAAKMVGRRKDGTPLVLQDLVSVRGSNAADAMNDFNFDADRAGIKCPFGAHVRRVNPRNGDMPWPPTSGLQRFFTLLGLQQKTLRSDAKASSRFHRILRRGREYGPADSKKEAPDVASQGLHFVCLAANIARQFEFLQSAWIMNSKFDAMTDESDPLLGSREQLPGAITDGFSIPVEQGPNRDLCALPRFVRVRGGAYFFLPSLPALSYLAAL